ncbi:nudix hydrolase 18, mitochondrial-like [Mercurialis annua]|uniref:nudix hydrolase 18, mitochondrial-like n=1 Tax=Mercurialis annua TaxID=3986 RepID=UPI00215E263C|nr:nudix hydrolase 18, mitochondrial-like [Mercurialis annua]
MKDFAFFVRNFQNLVCFFLPLLEKIPAKLLPSHIQNMVSLISRTGRHLQRYDGACRLVVGCIPYRFKKSNKLSSMDETNCEDIEVLVISSQKGQAMMFPKGGWEMDESMKDAAQRETLEEAGVIGRVECELGKWQYMSKRGSILHEGYMFPLLVQKQLEYWPEKNIRKRKWVSVKEAREVCPQLWMIEALDELVMRQTHSPRQQKEELNGQSNM